ncbi:hypothetical protein BW14_06955 [Bifidobacterium sp. UTBIF-68]|uniref:hypothetical protein n=1 Tax=Bifidobacterium sp. UTBIF-68 TaxID=1465262 RepID=UPI00112E4823|nr:hypothetical protein [Bifidobacterium sp. UTBIF-68]TPF92896.1 hypothetical protein BW14_06955 [Bifidobacterium sp. UTBIF-68]
MTYTRKQYAELGGLLSGTMLSDYSANTRATGIERDVFDRLTRLYMQDPAGFKANALEACHHAGLTERDMRSMTDWVNTRLLYTDGSLNTSFLWTLCVDSIDNYGNDVPLPTGL